MHSKIFSNQSNASILYYKLLLQLNLDSSKSHESMVRFPGSHFKVQNYFFYIFNVNKVVCLDIQSFEFFVPVFPQVHTRMSLHQKYFENVDKMGTITNIWPCATGTAYKKNNLQTFSQPQQKLLRDMQFF